MKPVVAMTMSLGSTARWTARSASSREGRAALSVDGVATGVVAAVAAATAPGAG